jgi:endonuclease YncB( thermonuclease family)
MRSCEKFDATTTEIKIYIFFFVLISLLLFGVVVLFAEERVVKVVSIHDGDTLTASIDGKTEKVRLANIDCPELDQPGGFEALKAARTLSQGEDVKVSIEGDKRDRFQRLIGVVLLKSKVGPQEGVLNYLLVKGGFCWFYPKYSNDGTYRSAEREARVAKKGLWAKPDPVAPWQWRKEKRR